MPGLLALLAHPDDEFFCAGLLAALPARGVPVHLAYWTRGEGGLSPKRRAFWSCFPRSWHPREAEARRAAQILRAASLSFLGAIDPAPAPGPQAPRQDSRVFADKLRDLLDRHAPDLLVTHGSNGEYGHPAHILLHELAREYVAVSSRLSLLSFNATWPGAPDAPFFNRDDTADHVFDSRPFFRAKMEIVRAHRSQRGVLESLSGAPDSTLRNLLRVSRLEGYHAWGAEDRRAAALGKLRQWVGGSVVGPSVV
jgi:LmbE family N-acetylglucosaminyl deacetylase